MAFKWSRIARPSVRSSIGHGLALLRAAGFELGQSFADDASDLGPVVERGFRSGSGVLDDPRQRQEPRDVESPVVKSTQALELIAIAGQGRQIQAVIIGPVRPFDSQVDLDRAAPHLLSNELLEGGLDHRVRIADLGAQLEMPVVDGAQLDRDRPSRVLKPGFSKSGHAQKQGSLTNSLADLDRTETNTTRLRASGRASVASGTSAAAAIGPCRHEYAITASWGDGRCLERVGQLAECFHVGWKQVVAGARAVALDVDPVPLRIPRLGLGVAARSPSRPRAALIAPSPTAGLRLVRTTMNIESKIQAMATPTVTLVKTSPVLAPKALDPPIPPKAPASPPPLPRWMRMRTIRNSVRMTITMFRKPRRIVHGLPFQLSSHSAVFRGVTSCPACTIARKSLDFKLAPPTKPRRCPATPGARPRCPASRSLRTGQSLAPAVAAPNCSASQSRMNAWAAWACSGVAVNPVPIAHTGSYAITVPAIASGSRPASEPVN